MRNVTVSLDDETYRRAKRYAVEHDKSLSAMVREYLNAIGTEETEFEHLKRQEMELRRQVVGVGTASNRLSREELYDRKAMREDWEKGQRG